MTLRLAIGPFAPTQHDHWPVVACHQVGREFQIVPFATDEDVPTDVDATIHWSPEYNPTNGPLAGYRVAAYGDWHVVPFEQHLDLLNDYQLVATDYRGTKRLAELGYPPEKTLWHRMFSFDPRLHKLPEREDRLVDVAFWGRPDGGKRDHALTRLKEICKRRGWEWNIRGRTPYLRGEEADGYRRAKVTWNLSARSELNMRVFEAAACGSLSMLEMDNAELWASNAPLVPWQWSTLEAQLDQWITNDAAREAKVREQQEWVQRNRPVDRLRALCVAIQERMERSGTSRTRISANTEMDTNVTHHPSPVSDLPSGSGNDASPETAKLGVPPGSEPTPSEQRQECVALVPSTAKRILDLGTNTGGVPWALKKRQDCYVVGVDLDEHVKDIAEARCDEFHLFNLTAAVEQWREQPWYQAGTYDAILMLDVVEHVLEPARLLESAKPLLAPGGVIVASVPQLRNVANLYDIVCRGRFHYFNHVTDDPATWEGPHNNVVNESHVRFFTKDGLERLFERSGFRIIQWEASRMSAPGLEKFGRDLVALTEQCGGEAEGLRESLLVIQWIFVSERVP